MLLNKYINLIYNSQTWPVGIVLVFTQCVKSLKPITAVLGANSTIPLNRVAL